MAWLQGVSGSHPASGGVFWSGDHCIPAGQL